MKLIAALVCLMSFAWGSDNSDDSDEKRFADMLDIQKKAKPEDVPEYKGVNVPESHLNHRTITAAKPAIEGQEGAEFINESFETRPHFNINPQTDPLFRQANDALKDADAIQNKTTFVEKGDPQFELVTCEETREEGSFDCYETLVDLKITINPAKSSHWWCTSGQHGPDDPACKAKEYYPAPKVYEEEKIHVSNLEWTGTCRTFEERAASGLCRQTGKVCTQKGGARFFEGLLNGKPVTRAVYQPCWQYKKTFVCGSESGTRSPCVSYRDQGYEQMSSQCSKTIGKVCHVWTQTFKKPLSTSPTQTIITLDQTGDPISGSRDQRLVPPDQNFADAASKLAIFNEMQKDLKNFTGAGDLREPKIFKGDQKKCRKNGFMNCCGSEQGSRVAVSVKLARCTADENDLFQKRHKGQCHYVGEYCALKVPLTGVCRLWKQSFCCFPSKLSRIVHEQGRPQINMHWGSSEGPNCEGFRVDALQRLDFARFDLSEFFDDIQKRTKIPDPTLVTSQLSNRFQTMASGQNNTRDGGH